MGRIHHPDMNKEDKNNSAKKRKPWWASSDPSAELPDGYPEPPDPQRVRDLQRQLTRDRASRNKPRDTLPSRLPIKSGRQVREIGSMTLIPTMMIAGPAVGYGLGVLVGNKWGGSPWSEVGGLVFGLVAAFRQIFLLLTRKNPPKEP